MSNRITKAQAQTQTRYAQPVIVPEFVELIIVDSFCGCRGFTEGCEQAVDAFNWRLAVVKVGINHDHGAIRCHAENHPETVHFTEDIRDESLPGRIRAIVDQARREYPNAKVLFHALCECTNFSMAKGGAPRDADSRSLAESMPYYLAVLNPDIFTAENVREFQCFPGETAVYTKRGIVPISEVIIGDYVMTHNSRWKQVVDKQSKISSTVSVKGLGNNIIECTPDHKFYTRQLEPVLSNKCGKDRHLRPRLLEPEWVEAQNLVRKSSTTYEEKYGKYLWATPTVFPVYPMRLPGIVTDQEAFLYMVGRWAGDGWIRKRTDRQNLIRICCHKKVSDELKAKLSETGFKWAQEGHTENVDVFTLGAAESKAIIPWPNNSFGEYAHKKTLPA